MFSFSRHCMHYLGQAETFTWRLGKINEHHLAFGEGEGDKKIGNR